MIETICRPALQKMLVEPVLPYLGRLSPTILTLLSGVLGVLAACLMLGEHVSGALVMMWSSGALDVLDGSLARYQGTTSPWGAALDIFIDRLVEIALIMGLVFQDPHQRALPGLWMLASVLLCVTAFLVVGVLSHHASEKGFYYSPGLMERAEAFLILSAMLVLPGHFHVFAMVFTVLVTWTALWHLRQFRRYCLLES